MLKMMSCAIAAAALAACSSTPIEEPKAPVSTAAATPAPQAPAPSADTAQTQVTTVTLDPLDDPKSGLAARSVYFDFDNFVIADKYVPLVQAHGQYIAAHKQAQIRVEGNADERGSHEYNLSLGDKRAHIVAKQLELMGANPAQIEAVSYGEERPKASGHDETAWAENRRADIKYLKH
jgi:peptidoglycan-associated lipoprotein